MNESFILSFVLIIVHYNIYKTDTSLHVNYFLYVKISVKATEDFFIIDRNLRCTSKGICDYIEFMFC